MVLGIGREGGRGVRRESYIYIKPSRQRNLGDLGKRRKRE
jgi:hypothetical protein